MGACRICGELLEAVAPPDVTGEARQPVEHYGLSVAAMMHLSQRHTRELGPIETLRNAAAICVATRTLEVNVPGLDELRAKMRQALVDLLDSLEFSPLERGLRFRLPDEQSLL